jgi:hypothetical protein
VETLVKENGGLPSGAKVVVWSPGGGTGADRDLKEMLASKRIVAAELALPLDRLSADVLEKLKQLDGLVPGSGVRASDIRAAKDKGLILLAAPPTPDFRAPGDGSDVGIVYTGVVPIVYKAQRALLDSLIQSTWWSFATILPLMMFVCRGVLAGGVVMLPNVLPVLIVFGGMGWLGVPVDIGSMMAASIALGVAVDDTIHSLPGVVPRRFRSIGRSLRGGHLRLWALGHADAASGAGQWTGAFRFRHQFLHADAAVRIPHARDSDFRRVRGIDHAAGPALQPARQGLR